MSLTPLLIRMNSLLSFHLMEGRMIWAAEIFTSAIGTKAETGHL